MYSKIVGLSRSRCWLPATLLVLAGTACQLHAQELDTLRTKFLKEAPRAWQSYLEFFRTLQGTSVGERRDNGKETLQGRSLMRQSGANRLDQMETFTGSSYMGDVNARNSRYRFRLTRKSGDRPWVIREVASLSADEDRSPIDTPTGLDCGPATYFPGLIQFPGFTLLAVAPEVVADSELVRVTFETSCEKLGVRRGWLLLDPAHDWVVRKGESELRLKPPGSGTVTYQYDYKEGSHQHLIPTRYSYRSTSKDEKGALYTYEASGHLDLHEESSVPESNFQLSAYGLPEPFEVAEGSPTRWYLWAGIAGIVCLVLGMSLRRLKGSAVHAVQG